MDILKRDFKDIDAKATAIYELERITQGTNSIETHNAKFNLLVSKGRLSMAQNQTLLVDFYQCSIAMEILEKC